VSPARASVRNGDWVAIDGMVVLLLGEPTPHRTAAAVFRGELGLGCSSLGMGLAMNSIAHGPQERYDMSDFLQISFAGVGW
jgi:hypothetical protein